jgi:hypothetical protein
MIRAVLLTAAIALASCGQPEPAAQAPAPLPGTEPGSTPPSPPRPRVIVRPPLVGSGPAQPLTLEANDDLQWAASVVKLQTVAGGSAKLFGLGGGDPAMNGLQTYIAFLESPAEGWRVYPVGDILDFTVLNEAAGRVDLEISESTMDPATQQIGSRTRRIIVAWTAPADGVPTSVTITPAR